MENFRKNIIIGHNFEGIIVANVEIRNGMFSVCFDTYSPVCISDFEDEIVVDYLVEILNEEIGYYASRLLSEYTSFDNYEIAKEIVEQMDYMEKLETFNHDIDYSINEIEKDNKIYLFELVGCGQNDTRNSKGLKVKNKALYNEIHKLWDRYHIKNIDKETEVYIIELLKNEYDYTIEFEDYFKNNYK